MKKVSFIVFCFLFTTPDLLYAGCGASNMAYENGENLRRLHSSQLPNLSRRQTKRSLARCMPDKVVTDMVFKGYLYFTNPDEEARQATLASKRTIIAKFKHHPPFTRDPQTGIYVNSDIGRAFHIRSYSADIEYNDGGDLTTREALSILYHSEKYRDLEWIEIENS